MGLWVDGKYYAPDQLTVAAAALAGGDATGSSPATGPTSERYSYKLVGQAGPQETVLKVDSEGRPVKAFTLDTGEADEAAISPLDILGPAVPKIAGEGLAFAGRLALRGLGQGIADAAANANLRGAGYELAEDVAEPVIQRGGAHADVRGIPGYEAHHMPAYSASPLRRAEGPAIAMLKEDHRLTASWGSGEEADAYRARQAALIKSGDFRAAQQMDIDDIRSKFGDKYNGAIRKMLNYTNKQGYGK